MAQLQMDPSLEVQEECGKESTRIERTTSMSKLNAKAPEFIPRSQSMGATVNNINTSGFVYPFFQVVGGDGTELCYFPEQELLHAHSFCSDLAFLPSSSRDHIISEDLRQKIVKQVEYQFSTANLACTDYLMKFINKDPEGYVPMPIISSLKKIKSLVSNNDTLVAALQTSTKLVVSADGKRVKRRYPLTNADIEDFQSRTVVVENLPDDYSHQNLEKIFGVVGSVKSVRICHPPESNLANSASSRSVKPDVLISNKLHALVEYENVTQAEKAIAELNDENWRKGLRVRLLLKRSPKASKIRKAEFDYNDTSHEDDNGHQTCELQDGCCQHSEHSAESNGDDNAKKGRGRGWVKCHGHTQCQKLTGSVLLQPPNAVNHAHQANKPTPPGPRMPDGTRGFTMGRGKPLASTNS